MRFTSYLDAGQLTIVLTGEIDHHGAKEYIQSILSKIEAYTPTVCILDFSEVSFMDSSGIAVVINAFRYLSKLNSKLRICGLQDQPMKVFRASGIDKLIEVQECVK